VDDATGDVENSIAALQHFWFQFFIWVCKLKFEVIIGLHMQAQIWQSAPFKPFFPVVIS